MIKLEKFSKQYKDQMVFDTTDFVANDGEITLLMGKSGTGKSTLLDILSGIKTYDSGTYFVNDQKINPFDDEGMSHFRNQEIGYILQDFALINDYSVLENISLPALYNKTYSKAEVTRKAKQLAVQFDIADILAKKVKNISGGQKQRVAIIRSLILEPSILLADEPTTNLDAENFALIMALFEQLKKANKAVIIATHDERILTVGDRGYQITDFVLAEKIL